MSFSSLGLSAALVHAVRERAYAKATSIQISAIPAILSGRDVIACAETGSGKTAAFCLPLLQMSQNKVRSSPRQVQTLILVPTRELAMQVGENLKTFAQHLPQPVKLSVVFGGVSINPQMLQLRGGSDIVVATPGRLLDLLAHNALQLGNLRSLVLDEADRMLEHGFSEELNRIIDVLPALRQNLFFSATFPEELSTLAETMLHDPLRIDVSNNLFEADTSKTKPDICQRAISIDAKQRTQLLRHLIQTQKWSRVLVFVASKYAADLVAVKLRRSGIRADAFHGELSQGKRTQVLNDFKASRISVVIATDIAARGIDILQLPVVINYDLPRSSEDYTHRIGRTGRAGESGIALSFVCSDSANEAHFRLIEQRHHQKIEREIIAGFEPTHSEKTALKPSQNLSPETTKLNHGIDSDVYQSPLQSQISSHSTDPIAQGLELAKPSQGGIKGKRPNKKDKLRAQAAMVIPLSLRA